MANDGVRRVCTAPSTYAEEGDGPTCADAHGRGLLPTRALAVESVPLKHPCDSSMTTSDVALDQSPAPPSVLLVGAYERDNFGDLLFLHQTERYLEGAHLEVAAPFPGATSENVPRVVPGYAAVMRSRSFDHIWTVGGEVGDVTVDTAAIMSAPAIAASVSGIDCADSITALTGLDPKDGAYLVNPRLLPPFSRTELHVNSVGVSRIVTLNSRRRWRLLRSLYASRHVSVRDSESSRILTRFGISHTLAPDLIQTIALTRPRGSDPQPDVALFQMSEELLSRHGPARVANALASSFPRHMKIELFVAGSAPGHDSVALYEQVKRALRASHPHRAVEISSVGSALDRADQIARSGLWIGSSLHGRIVSCAYDIPRISLEVDKVTAYARTWDRTMPYGVALEHLPHAVERALQPASRSVSAGHNLAMQAEQNIEAMSADLFHSHDRAGFGRVPTRPRSALRVAARVTREIPIILRHRLPPRIQSISARP